MLYFHVIKIKIMNSKNIYSLCTYLDVRDSNGPLLSFLVNGYAIFSSERKNLIFTVPFSMQYYMKF